MKIVLFVAFCPGGKFNSFHFIPFGLKDLVGVLNTSKKSSHAPENLAVFI